MKNWLRLFWFTILPPSFNGEFYRYKLYMAMSGSRVQSKASFKVLGGSQKSLLLRQFRSCSKSTVEFGRLFYRFCRVLFSSCNSAYDTNTRWDRRRGPYLGLGIDEEEFVSPYYWYLPSIAYLDYDHAQRLFWKILNTKLEIWPSGKKMARPQF